MKDKIAFVCQRYGLEVNGGAELLCRQLAEKLCNTYDVEVYTTCAIDYITWRDEYQPGTEVINGVTVHRYRVDKKRDTKTFAQISDQVMTNPNHTDEEEERWLNEQGPTCTALLKELAHRHGEYKAVLFMTYLYYLTVKGLQLKFDNAILIPTVHDEPPVYLRCYDAVFNSSKKFIWQTHEEKEFAEKRFPGILGMNGVYAGAGVDVPSNPFPNLPRELVGQDYVVYAGRIDASKGCDEMFRFFRRYKEQYGGELKLVLMGKAVMPIPNAADIVSLGFVSDEMKFKVMQEAKALVLFSKFESLSMVVLESMTMGRPVLVNGQCEVLKGHCIRSNAGLYFENYPEFAATLNYLLSHDAEYAVMCENGKKYVEENYRWNIIVKRICGLIDQKQHPNANAGTRILLCSAKQNNSYAEEKQN